MALRHASYGGPKMWLPAYRVGHSAWWVTSLYLPQCIRPVADVMALNDPMDGVHDASTATPGQAGLPAEFKHINKRRRRNLQGFP